MKKLVHLQLEIGENGYPKLPIQTIGEFTNNLYCKINKAYNYKIIITPFDMEVEGNDLLIQYCENLNPDLINNIVNMLKENLPEYNLIYFGKDTELKSNNLMTFIIKDASDDEINFISKILN